MKLVGARYGLRGVRVGEACLPGLPDATTSEFDMTLEDSSDDGDPVDDASEGGHVQPMDTAIDRCSDTESVAELRRRRLRLVWDPSVQPRVQQQQWHREARVVEGLLRSLGGRVGVLPQDAPYPRAIRQQRWSPVNVLSCGQQRGWTINSGIGLDDPSVRGNPGASGVP